MEDVLFVRSAWMQRLYDAHGYGAVATRHRDGVDAVTHLYPASFFLFANATGVIVHNAECRDLARRYFGDVWADRIREIAQLRSIPPRDERAAARARLGLGDRFVLCSFGFVVEPKRIVELIKAWNAAALGAARPCMLALVGGLPDGPYAQEVRRLIAASPDGSPVVVTGFASPQVYEDYLAAADVAVQLRAHSRGESSRAAVDCMAAGLPTIVNAHGSLAEFPDDCVVKIPDRFTVDELTQAIVALASDAERRAGLSARAVAHIRAVADPTAVARRYRDAIEAFAADAPPARDLSVLRKTAAALEARDASKAEWVAEARGLALASPAPSPARRLYVDISELARHDLRTGIQRVARGQLTSLLDAPPAGFRVEPVYLEAQGGQWTLRYAADATLRLLGLPSGALIEDVVDARPGDVYFMPDYSPVRVADAAEAGLYRALRDKGVHIAFSVYDNLPIRHPRFFPDYAAAEHARWLKAAGESADTLICISETVAADTNDWLGANLAAGTPLPECRAIHLGADLSGSAPTTGLPPDGEDTLGRLRARPTFLMVGTIEPRKGYAQALAAFETLWRDKMEVNLVIVGREGWSGLPASQRRTIPDIVRALEESRFAGDRLFWFRDVSDEYLARIYEVASCLLAASEAEGFGLPLIEAAQHGLPLLVRDIPVFHEVAGCHATYFSGEEPQDLAQAIERWLALKAADAEVRADAMEWITWKENARRLVDVLIK